MTKMSKREYLIELKQKYHHANRKQKTQLLDDFCEFTKYHRKSALRLIHERLPSKWKRPAIKEKYYDQEVCNALLILWRAADEICGERFQPFISKLLKKMVDCGEIQVTDEVKEKLLQISMGQVKRILHHQKRISTTKIKGTTRPGSLLKHQIAIRYGPWEEVDPGFFEMDTVAHCGETVAGSFIYSLDLVDIATGWAEQGAIWGKGERATLEQFKKIEKRLPFKILGIDPDNGSEFINYHMYRHCQKSTINFTRSRPYHKNDNAHIEQKNWTAIRQLVGYDRLDKKKQLKILNDLYENSWRLYINFFQPTMKLKEKIKNTKTGKTKKKYYEAKTPYQRILEHKKIDKETKKVLKAIYKELNPVKLKLEIKEKLKELRRTL
jgi:hypothetical protein